MLMVVTATTHESCCWHAWYNVDLLIILAALKLPSNFAPNTSPSSLSASHPFSWSPDGRKLLRTEPLGALGLPACGLSQRKLLLGMLKE